MRDLDRFDHPADGLNAWPLRKEMAAGIIEFHGADIAVLRTGVLPGTWGGRIVSDHNPVLAEIWLAPR